METITLPDYLFEQELLELEEKLSKLTLGTISSNIFFEDNSMFFKSSTSAGHFINFFNLLYMMSGTGGLAYTT